MLGLVRQQWHHDGVHDVAHDVVNDAAHDFVHETEQRCRMGVVMTHEEMTVSRMVLN